MTQLFANNAKAQLNANITNVVTSLTVTSGQGALFPVLTGSDFFLVTLFEYSGSGAVNHEVVRVTARTTDTFTLLRGQEGTVAQAWVAGDNLELRVTKETLDSFHADGDNIAAGTFSATSISTTGSIVITGAGLVDGVDIAVLGGRVDDLEVAGYGDQSAAEVAFTNTTSGLTATNVQAAIDEVEARLDTEEGHDHTGTYEPDIGAKLTAFNKNFGNGVGTVCQGSDGRLDDARTPLGHIHGTGDITNLSGTNSGDNAVNTLYNTLVSDTGEPGIFSGGGVPTLATGVTAAEIRSLIGAGTSSTTGDITNVTVTAPVAGGGTSGSVNISMLSATTSRDGYLTQTDWDTFNNKQVAGSYQIAGSYETAFTKNTAFNVNFGTGNGDVPRGDHTHAAGAAPAITDVAGTPTLAAGITAAEVRSTIGAGTGNGDITGVTAGTGLSGGATSGTATLNLNFAELTDMTANIAATTEFIIQNGTTESRKAASEIQLSNFSNNSNWNNYSHPSDGVDPGVALVNAAVFSDITVNAAGHVTGTATRNLTAANVGASATGHTHTAASATSQATGYNKALGTTAGTVSEGNHTHAGLLDWAVTQAADIHSTNYTDTVYTHPSDGGGNIAALTGANVYSDITINTAGHVTGTTTRAMTAANVGAAASSHNHSGGNITSGTVGYAYLPTGTAASTVAIGNHTHSGYAATSHGNHVPTTQAADNAVYLRNDNTWQTISAADVGAQVSGSYATATHTHDTYDRVSSVLSSAAVFSNLVITNGIVTNTATRNLTAGNIGAATSGHNHSGTYALIGGSGTQVFAGSTITATTFNATSDERLKDVIENHYTCNALTIDAKLFNWKDGSGDNQIGYIAQEVERVIPEAVTTTDDGMKSVNYNMVLVAKVSELEENVAALTSLVNALLETK